jgi:hypothetical protein
MSTQTPFIAPDESADAIARGAESSAPGLADLQSLPLSPQSQRVLDHLCTEMLGPPSWRRRKRIEAHGLMALAQIAPRLVIRHLDLRTELGAIVELRDTPVPCMKPGQNDIELAEGTVLAIKYPEAILLGPIPGTQPVRVLEPHHVFHSNVAYGDPMPPLCLGANVPRGFPLREMVLTAYGALTLQAISLDALDPAGVLNPQAVIWYQANASRVPLTTMSFLGRPGAASLRGAGGGASESQSDEGEEGKT